MMAWERIRWTVTAGALILFAALLVGRDAAEESNRPSRGEPVSCFDSRTAQAIRGTVHWGGAIPTVPALRARVNLSLDGLTHLPITRPNPNAPQIDPGSRAVGNAVIFLRGVTTSQPRPWDLPPVLVEMSKYRLVVRQGDTKGTVGFVRRGGSLTMVSREPVFHVLHAGGAAFFGLPFPDPQQARRRSLHRQGVVELTSGAGYYWMRGYVFVDDHPYYTRTDGRGQFVLPQVPPGSYDLVCWMPNWKEARHERDPETGLITRLVFGPPAESVRRVTVSADRPGPEVGFTISASDFR